jgi:hypothetical protein
MTVDWTRPKGRRDFTTEVTENTKSGRRKRAEVYNGKHGREYHEYILLVNSFVGYHSNGAKALKAKRLWGKKP